MEGKRGFSVSISGHRPGKLPTGQMLRMLQSMLYFELFTAIQEGADTFYVGMAQGMDLWAAEYLLSARQKSPLRLIAVEPFAGHIARLSGSALYRSQNVLERADETVVLAPHYYRGCFAKRNLYLVEHCQRLIAVMLDPRSGTGQTVRAAKRAGVDVRCLTLPTVTPEY